MGFVMALAPGRVMPALPGDRSSKGDKKEYFGGKTGVSMALALVAHGSPFFGSCVRLRFQRAGQQKLDGEGRGGKRDCVEVAAFEPPDSVLSWGEEEEEWEPEVTA